MPAAPDATPERIKDANTRYHDAAATSYDSKWGIDFGDVGQGQVRDKMRKALGFDVERPFGDALEIGAGTGYFALNLLQMGMIERVTATDISPGMLASLEATAASLGLEAETVACEAEQLPFDDGSFDLVFGHAVLHHIPDLRQALAEFRRVLRPGGYVAFCGEPSRYGDRLAAVPKRAAMLVAPLWRTALRAPAAAANGAGTEAEDDHSLENEVDVHAFAPADLRRAIARAGFADPRVQGEELLSNMYGWGLRTVESTADPEGVPFGWRLFAYRSFIALQRLDATALEPRLPAELFYNLLISARNPE